jgi:hypothetical protein
MLKNPYSFLLKTVQPPTKELLPEKLHQPNLKIWVLIGLSSDIPKEDNSMEKPMKSLEPKH